MKNLSYSFILLISFLLSCRGNENNEVADKETENIVEKQNKNETTIEVLFDEPTFQDDQSLIILRELGLGMCNPLEKDLENFIKPACNSKFFKLFPYKDKTQMKDAFILLIKSKVHGFPIRRAFVYQRENGKLIKVNGFVANLIGMRKNKSGYNDLILRFADEFQNHFNCLYTWSSNRYEFAKVEAINDSKIKSELQDSMNVEILKEIELNKMQNL